MKEKTLFVWFILGVLCSSCISINSSKAMTLTSSTTLPEITRQPIASTSTPSPMPTKLSSPTITFSSTPTPMSTPLPSPTKEDPFVAFCEDPQSLADVEDESIAFIADWDGKMKIYSIHPDGSGLFKLSGSQAVNGWPVAWSPDGKRIAFVVPDTYADQFVVGNRQPGKGQLYIMNLDGTEGSIPAPDLPVIPEAGITWSPDSQRLAFGLNLPKNESYLYVMRANGSDQKNLTDNNGFALGWAAWSADGKEVAYAQVYILFTGDKFLGIGASDRKEYRLINYTSEYATLENPAWSPVDVNLLAFQGYTFTPWGCGRQLFIKNLQTGVQTQITHCEDVSGGYWWSPNGYLIAHTTFYNDRPTFNLYHLPTDHSQILLTFPTGVTSMAWSPDSHWIAFTRWEEGVETTKGLVDLYLLNVCNSTLRLITEKLSVKYDIFWAP